MPGVAAKDACLYESALTWALEAEKLDLPRLSAQCERFIAMHWEHLHKYALLIDSLSSPARRRVMMGIFPMTAPKRTIVCKNCHGNGRMCIDDDDEVGDLYALCPDCDGTGEVNVVIKYPSLQDFMSWRTAPDRAS